MNNETVKKRLMLLCVSWMVLCSFSGCGSKGEGIYQDVLERYVTAMEEDWDGEMLRLADMSALYATKSDAEEDVGYCFYDVDGNGNPELLIGDVSPSSHYTGMIYDMYTLVEGSVFPVLSGRDNHRYFLCEDNEIELISSDGTDYRYNLYYEFDGATGKLQPREAIIYDTAFDEEKPWFYTSGSLERSEYTMTTEREAKEITDSYVHKGFEVTPFSKYK